jgi:hypothetical protein
MMCEHAASAMAVDMESASGGWWRQW